LGPSQISDGAQGIILLDVILGFTLAAQFQTNAIDALNAHVTAS